MKKIIIVLLAIFLLFSCSEDDDSSDLVFVDAITGAGEVRELSIMSFNIQILGRSKSSKFDVMNVIIDIIDDYDLIAIQEVRDNTNQTLTVLMGMMPNNYKIVVGPREGRSNSKEQAIFIYDDNVLDLSWSFNFEDWADVFERSPFVGSFVTDDGFLTFNMLNIHISPSDATVEIEELAAATMEVYDTYYGHVVVLGDFNADGSYFREENLSTFFDDRIFDIIIENEWNTTVAQSQNTYDRIIVNDEFSQYIKRRGVLYFNDYLPEGLEAKRISDHYPVWMELEY